MGDIQQRTESALDRALPGADIAPARLHDAMRYAVAGRRQAGAPCCCATPAAKLTGAAPALDRVACAVEMIHAYSLVHDDLPCMDDDVLRRGKPTCTSSSTKPPRCWWATPRRPRPSSILADGTLCDDRCRSARSP